MTKKKAKPQAEPEAQPQPQTTIDDDWGHVQTMDDLPDLARIKMALYGPSGAGKSTAAGKFPNPLIAVTEVQSIPVYKKIAPNAKIITVQSADDLARLRRILTSPDLAQRVDSVVLDSFTDAQRIMHDYILGQQKKTRGDMKILTLDNWGVLKQATLGLFRTLRDAPVHVCAIFLDNEETIEGVGQVHRLALAGSSRNEAAQFFNSVGYQHTRQTANGVAYQTLFRGGSRYLAKGLSDLRDIEPAEPAVWISRLTGDAGVIDAATAARVAAWVALDDDSDDDE